jgi:hypothetical protein
MIWPNNPYANCPGCSSPFCTRCRPRGGTYLVFLSYLDKFPGWSVYSAGPGTSGSCANCDIPLAAASRAFYADDVGAFFCPSCFRDGDPT